MEEGKVISYGVVGGYVNDAPLAEAGIGVDWDSRKLILDEQERTKAQQGQSWQRKAAMPMTMSAEVDPGGGILMHHGVSRIYIQPGDVDQLARACNIALNKRNATSR